MRTALIALTLMAAASGRAAAAADDDSGPFEARPTAVYAVLGVGTPVGFAWGNPELGGELRLPSGLALRHFGGYGHIFAGDLVCDPPATSCGPYYQNDGYNLIYFERPPLPTAARRWPEPHAGARRATTVRARFPSRDPRRTRIWG